jgi:hypothetical protein
MTTIEQLTIKDSDVIKGLQALTRFYLSKNNHTQSKTDTKTHY